MNNGAANKKRKFNFADFIILLVAVSLIFLLIKLFMGDLSFGFIDTKEVRYTVKLEKIDEDISKLILQGQTVYDNTTGNPVGIIESIEIRDAVYSEYDSEAGYYKNYRYPDLKDITVTVTSECEIKENGYNVNGFNIIAGKALPFRTSSMYADGIITGAQEIVNDTSVISDPQPVDSLQ